MSVPTLSRRCPPPVPDGSALPRLFREQLDGLAAEYERLESENQQLRRLLTGAAGHAAGRPRGGGSPHRLRSRPPPQPYSRAPREWHCVTPGTEPAPADPTLAGVAKAAEPPTAFSPRARSPGPLPRKSFESGLTVRPSSSARSSTPSRPSTKPFRRRGRVSKINQLEDAKLAWETRQFQMALTDLKSGKTWRQQVVDAEDLHGMLKKQGCDDIGLERIEAALCCLNEHEVIGCHHGEKDAVPIHFFIDIISRRDLGAHVDAQVVEDVISLRRALLAGIGGALLEGRRPRRWSVSGSLPRLVCAAWRRPAAALEVLVMLAIVANTVLVGVSTEVAPGWGGWEWIERFFTLFFAVELLAKCCSQGPVGFYAGPEWRWNVADTAVVALSVADVLVVLTLSADFNGNVATVVRCMRMARVARLIRLIRVPMFHEFAHMVMGIAAVFRTLSWAFVLVCIVCYVSAVLLTQTIGQRPVEVAASVGDSAAKFERYRAAYFSSVDRSMFTVFRCIFGSCATFDGLELVLQMREVYGVAFQVLHSVFLVLVSLGLFNLIGSLFVQNTLEASKYNDATRRHFQIREREMVAQKTQQLLHKFWEASCAHHAAGSGGAGDFMAGHISRPAFEQVLQTDDEVNHLLDDLQLDENDRDNLFDILDADANGYIELPELVAGLVRLRGPARTSTLEHTFLAVQSLHGKLVRIEQLLLEGQV